MQIIRQYISSQRGQPKDHQERVALAAALVHDVGHGMFSHAFEEIGKTLKLKMAEHEHVSDLLIRQSEISQALNDELGSGFANDVADVIGRGRPGNLYDAVVSSQFDADRLDYMQRDRLMAGVQNSGIDFVWLINNLEIADIPTGADDEQSGTIATFVLGPKAIHAAETYVLALFQLYPTVYFHKATRGAEKIFSAIIMRLFELNRMGHIDRTGLAKNHPIVKFADDPTNLENALALDDTVFWGALPILMTADDPLVSQFAKRLWSRDLLKCIDVHQEIVKLIGAQRSPSKEEHERIRRKIKRIVVSVKEALEEYLHGRPQGGPPKLLIDQTSRHPYKRLQESKGPLNQIMVRQGDNIYDMADISPIIAALEPFDLLRVYYNVQDTDVLALVHNTIADKIKDDKE
jgi:HD superfamily phosphohydrolase